MVKAKKNDQHIDILIVEDSPTQAIKLRHFLEQHKYRVTAARNGREALEIVEKNKPTLIISDIVMPEIDGFELCRKIKTNEQLKDIPILLLSALSDPEDIIHGLTSGADNFLTKPYEEKLLLSRIEYVLVNRNIRKNRSSDLGIEIFFAGKKHLINSDRLQILDLLFSTYDTTIQRSHELERKNKELEKMHEELKELNTQLEQKVLERTDRIRDLNSLILAVRNVNQLITREPDLDRLINGACDNLISTKSFSRAMIVLTSDPDKLTGAADSGLRGKFLPLLKRIKPNNLPSTFRKALEQDKAVYTKARDPECEDCPLLSICGHGATVSARLEHAGVVYGIILVTLPADDTLDDESLGMLKEVCGDIAFALYAINQEHEQKILQQIVKESEQHYRSLFENMLEGFALCRMIYEKGRPRDFIYLEVNEAFESLTGLKNVAGKKVSEVIPGIRESDPELFEIYGRVALTGKPERFETYVKSLKMWFDISVYSPKKEHFVAVFDVITERKRNEEALKQAEKRFRELFDNMSSGVAVYNAIDNGKDFVFVDYNKSSERIDKVKKQEVVGKRVTEVFPGVKKMGLFDIFKRVWRTGKPEYSPASLYRDESLEAWRENYVYKLPTGEVVAVYDDITERKQAEEARLESETRYRTLFDNSCDAIYLLDLEGRIIDVNRVAEKLLGYSREELLKMSVAELDTPKNKPFVWERIKGLLRDGFAVFESENIRKDGTIVPLEISARVIEYQGGQAILSNNRDISLRIAVEKKLRESEKKFRELYDYAPVGYHELDREGNIVRVNRTEADLLGYTVDEMLGRPVFEFIAPEERAQSRELFKAKISGRKKIQPFERTYQCKAGRIINCLIDEKLVQDDTGKILGIRTTVRDISELKKAEEQIKELAKFPAENPDPVLRVDKDGRIFYANKSSEALLNAWSRAEGDILPAEMFEVFMRAFKTGKNVEAETRGGEKEYLFTFAAIAESGYVNLYGRDITDRKRAEEGRRLLETAFEQTAEAVFITDPEGDIIYTNPAFEKITGFTRQEALGRKPSLLKSGQHKEEFYRDLWDTITAGRVWQGRFINRKKDGTLYHEEATISPVKDAAGRITNFAAVKRDISQELDLENQLRHSQKMESIGLLAGGVAHDFNNILTTVLGYSSMMARNQELPEKYRKRIGEIETAAQRGANIARQLLTFSRKRPPKLEPLNLNEIIKQSLNFLKRTLGPNINILIQPGSNLDPVDADSTQVQQILLNLAVNARDAMPEEGNIVIRTENVEIEQNYIQNHLYAKPGPHVMLTFSDSGSGMDSETQKRIFEPFFTTKEIGKGTGLGLSVVYGIVKNHAGLINVYSELGRGTTFKIYFPSSAGTARTAVKEEAPVKGGHETVLVVDDEVMILNLVLSILEDYGYKCLTAENGAKALELYREHQTEIALVLLDIVMPKMGGPEVFAKLKSLNPGIKVIMSSGFSVQDEEELASSGVRAFVPKPYQASLLGRKIREVLDLKD